MCGLQAVAVLSILATTGCPSEFGKDGRVAKAVHKDSQDQLGIKKCSEQRKKEVCEGPRRNSKECRQCGG
jgi:hypothetical protein